MHRENWARWREIKRSFSKNNFFESKYIHLGQGSEDDLIYILRSISYIGVCVCVLTFV